MKIKNYEIHPVRFEPESGDTDFVPSFVQCEEGEHFCFGLYERKEDESRNELLEWISDHKTRNEAAIKAVSLGLSSETTFTLHQE